MRYSKLKGQQVHGICPPRFQTLMCGCERAEQDNKGNITLIYTDGTTETAPFPERDIAEFESFFSIVGNVQDRARNAKATQS